jgi:hypothetical protein
MPSRPGVRSRPADRPSGDTCNRSPVIRVTIRAGGAVAGAAAAGGAVAAAGPVRAPAAPTPATTMASRATAARMHPTFVPEAPLIVA